MTSVGNSAPAPQSTVPVPHAEATSTPERIRIEQHSFTGLLWLMGWLFTIGFLQLPFWKGVLALLVWPYYLGSAVRGTVL